jgi:hypothetical protein
MLLLTPTSGCGGLGYLFIMLLLYSRRAVFQRRRLGILVAL